MVLIFRLINTAYKGENMYNKNNNVKTGNSTLGITEEARKYGCLEKIPKFNNKVWDESTKVPSKSKINSSIESLINVNC